MNINTGGCLSSEDVIGRDMLIDNIWKTLEVQSVILSAERRMGKTSILKKMRDEPRHYCVLIYCDLENITSPDDFVECVRQSIQKHLNPIRKVKELLRKTSEAVGIKEINGDIPIVPEFGVGVKFQDKAKKCWKASLKELLCDVKPEVKEHLIFLWDEMPMMLYGIKENWGQDVAMQVLDTLRAIRQDPNTQSIRMVFTGSIGMHHVLDGLLQSGRSNCPVNDMLDIAVPGLESIFALELAEGLLLSIGIMDSEVRKKAALEIAEATDNVPYYIHHFIHQISGNPSAITSIKILRNSLLKDIQDPLKFCYYLNRIKPYYADKQLMALSVLDALAFVAPLSLAELKNRVKLKTPIDDDELFNDTLLLLQKDHYIQENDSMYQFQKLLIRDAWKEKRKII